MTIQIQAAPGPVAFDPSQTAVIVVDMLNDFAAVGGMFHRAGIDTSPIQAVVQPTARVLNAARRAGMKILYLKMEFRPDLSDAGAEDSPNWLKHQPLGIGKTVVAPNGQEFRILVKGSWGTEILPELAPLSEDIVVSKHRYSGFYETDLDAILRSLGIRNLVFTGCTTSVCVESTVRDAMFRDYVCLVLSDCVAEPIGQDLPRTNHQASLLVLQTLFAWVSDSSEFCGALQDQPILVET